MTVLLRPYCHPTSPTDQVMQLIDQIDPNTTYICEANGVTTATSAASWLIKKIQVVNSVMTVTWVSRAFDQVADNRSSLTYN